MGFFDSVVQKYQKFKDREPKEQREAFEIQCDAACNAGIDFVNAKLDVVADIVDEIMAPVEEIIEERQNRYKGVITIWDNRAVIIASYYRGELSENGIYQFDEGALSEASISFHVDAFSSTGGEVALFATYFGELTSKFRERTGESMFSFFIEAMNACEDEYGYRWDEFERYLEFPMIYISTILGAVADYMVSCGYSVEFKDLYVNKCEITLSW